MFEITKHTTPAWSDMEGRLSRVEHQHSKLEGRIRHCCFYDEKRESNFAPVRGSGQPTAVVAEGGSTVERIAENTSEANSVEALRRMKFNLRESQRRELSEEHRQLTKCEPTDCRGQSTRWDPTDCAEQSTRWISSDSRRVLL